MSRLQTQIDEFHMAMGQDDVNVPTDPSDEVRMRRARLIMEEAMETCFALVGASDANDIGDEMWRMCAKKRGCLASDIVEIVDGCADTMVVACGTLCELGVADDPILDLVMRSNMAKIGGGRDENGKFKKPPGWKPPAILEALVAQGYGK